MNCADPVGVSPCETCPSCQKFISGAHPDIITVEPQGIFIKIDQVRSLARQLRFAPLEGRWRVVIINDAQAMIDHQFSERLRAIYLDWKDSIVDILEQAKQEGIFKDWVNPESLALLIIGAIQGTTMMAHLDPERIDLSRLLGNLRLLLLEGVHS